MPSLTATANNTPLLSIFNVPNTYVDIKKRENLFEITEDIITLSATWNRLQKSSPIGLPFSGLLDKELLPKVTIEDRDHAARIRDYFSKKIMMWKLKGNGLMSTYRMEMNELIHSDGRKFPEKMIGIAYYLPRFYEHDLKFDEIKSRLSQQEAKTLDQYHMKEHTLKLTPVSKLYKKTSRVETNQYWFMNDKGTGVRITIDAKNPLTHIWEHMFERESLTITGYFQHKDYDGFHFLTASNWKLENIG